MIGTEDWGPAVGGPRQAIDNEEIIAGVLMVDGVAVSCCRVPELADDPLVVAWLSVARLLVTPRRPSQTLTGSMLRRPTYPHAPGRPVGRRYDDRRRCRGMDGEAGC
jgi:hypothetical protein